MFVNYSVLTDNYEDSPRYSQKYVKIELQNILNILKSNYINKIINEIARIEDCQSLLLHRQIRKLSRT